MIKLRPFKLISTGIPILAVLLRMGPAPTADLSYMLIAVYALFGFSNVIRALALSWLFTMLSPGIAPDPAGAAIGRYVVLFFGAFAVLLRAIDMKGIHLSKQVMATLLLGFFLLVHSVMFSAIPDVSVLKALSWLLAASTSIAAWSGLNGKERIRLSEQLFGGLVLVALLSLPLVASPLGYLVNGTGFQGIMNHPQSFGPTMGLLGAWAASKLLAQCRPAWLLVALVGLCLVLVVLSEARTAGVSMILGVLVASVTVSMLSGRPIRNLMPGLRSRRMLIVVGFAMMLAVLMAPMLAGRVDTYISKRSGTDSLSSAYEASRGRLINQMWSNIQLHPWHGIGFGIASDPASMVIERDPIFGLPVGAPVEKGVLPLAILEELGILGFLAVAAWVWLLLRRAARGGGVVAVTILVTLLLVNMGESMLFSAGGMGLLLLILLGWASTEPRYVNPASGEPCS